MSEKLISCQTGFVPNCGISLNQYRIVDRVTMRTNSWHAKKHVFALFIDFSSAYNTVLHLKLYEKQVLHNEEIELIKAIYSRFRIKLGGSEFTPNIGVAQGSVSSPTLYNIYCEDMYEKVNNRADVSREYVGVCR